MSDWNPGVKTKHAQILQYIEELEIGTKISVRSMAKEQGVSEGTAYRAMKEAGLRGLVSTKERIGTIRIEQHPRTNLYQLTFTDVVDIVAGKVLGGTKGLHKTLNKFVIGAMKKEAMLKYIDAGSLLIIGNRDEALRSALKQGAAVLITGGFSTTEEIKQIADERELPIISSTYDTFTVASMMNREMYDRMIKKKMMLVEDMISDKEPVYSLKTNHKVKHWEQLCKRTANSRFPVVDEWNRLVGMLTSKDVEGAAVDVSVDKLMTRNPISIQHHTSAVSAAQTMVWEGIEVLPVVDDNRKLIGVVSRSDALRAMQLLQRQPKTGETIEDIIWAGFERSADKDELRFHGIITPQMTNHLGTVSEGVLSTIMTKAAYHAINVRKSSDLVLDNMLTYHMKPIQLESEIVVVPRVIELSRKFGKVEVEVFHKDTLMCKCILTAQMLDPT